MKSDIKQLWIDALRSGEYEQGQYALKHHDTYCCLGVLCDLAVKEGICKEREVEGSSDHLFGVPGDYDPAILPIVVRKWAGLEYGDPDVKTEEGDATTLSEMNDQSYSFSEIADAIDANL